MEQPDNQVREDCRSSGGKFMRVLVASGMRRRKPRDPDSRVQTNVRELLREVQDAAGGFGGMRP